MCFTFSFVTWILLINAIPKSESLSSSPLSRGCRRGVPWGFIHTQERQFLCIFNRDCYLAVNHTFLVVTQIFTSAISALCLNLNHCHHHRCLGGAAEEFPRDSSTHKGDTQSFPLFCNAFSLQCTTMYSDACPSICSANFAMQCNVLQCTQMHCNVLKCTTIY